jgi:dihydrofolate synthase/folylpolyglutamate synthase
MVNLPHWPKVPIWNHGRKNDLQLTRQLLKALGDPHKKLPPTIHVAGTNGKGSTCAMLKSIFEAAGYKVHSYTSPHLLEFNERINLAGVDISDHHLFELLEIVRVKSEELDLVPSFFEGVTIAAFLAFAESPADVLILETGMGGRLDATNVIQNPILTIITPISFDHMQYLGSTLLAIAAEKAGIIKAGVPCIISAQTEEVYQVLFDKCEELASPAFAYEYDYIIEPQEDELKEELVYRSQKYSLSLPKPSLVGSHQYINAAAVVAATLLINDQFKISGEDIALGLKNTRWPGRIEKIPYKKYSHLAPKNITIYLDGAHNDGGARALSSWIKENITEPVYLIIGMTKNRNVESFCRAFQGIIKTGRAVKVLSEPSSYHPDVITSSTQKYDMKFGSSDSLSQAIAEIDSMNKDKEATIVITGSLFLVSDFYRLI